MKKVLSILLVVALSLCCLVGAVAEKSSKDTLVIAVAGDIPSLKGGQNSRTTASLTWPTMFSLKETESGGYEYVIDDYCPVASAVWDDEKITLTVTFKENITMHDGTILDADDAAFSISYECTTGNMLNGSPNMATDGSGVEIIDNKTVKLTFLSKNVDNWNLAGHFRIFSKESFEASGAADLQSYGMDTANFASFGPYRFVGFVPGDSLTFEKFDDYFMENDSTIRNIMIRRIDEPTVAMMELQTGGVDVIMYPTESDIVDVNAGIYDNIKATSAAGLYQQLIVFNLDASSKCANPNVRKALCYAIDRESMWIGAFESSGLFADTPVTRTQEFIETYEDPYPQDLEKAKEMLLAEGIEEGSTFVVCVDNDVYRTTAVEMFKNALEQIGYNVEIKTGDNAAYLNEVLYTVDWDLEFGKSGMIGSVAHWANSQWEVFNHGNTAKEDFTEFYALRDAVLAEFDSDARYALTQDYIDAYVNKYCISYPIRQDVYTNLMVSKLENFTRWGEQWNVIGAYYENE